MLAGRLHGRLYLFSAFLAISGLLLFALGAMLHRSGLISTLVVMMMLVAHGGLAVLSGLVLAGATLRRLVMRRRLPRPLPFLAALIAFLAAATPVAIVLSRILAYPMISDLSTDLDHPPAFQALSKRPDSFANDLGRFHGDAVKQSAAYPALVTRRYAAALDAVQAAAERELVGLPAEDMVRRDEAGAVLIEFTWRPGLFRFANVFVLRLMPDGQGTRVDLRAASRYGNHDFGANAELMQEIFQRLDAQFP